MAVEQHSPMEMLGSITVDTDSAYDLGTTAKRFANIFADVVDTPIVDLSMTQGSVLFIDSNGRIAQDNTNFFWDDANNRLGIGIASPDGTLHVHTGSAGAVTAAGNADDLVVEVAGAGGISILTPDGSNSQIFMGSPSDTSGVIIKWNHTADLFTWGTSNLNAQVSITSGNGVEAVRINSSGNFDFQDGNLTTSGTLTLCSLTQGSVVFVGSGRVLSQDNTNYFWDNSNKHLKITHPFTGTSNNQILDLNANITTADGNDAFTSLGVDLDLTNSHKLTGTVDDEVIKNTALDSVLNVTASHSANLINQSK